MNNSINSGKLITDLEQFARVRFQVASYLNQIARTLAKSEIEAENNSGKLGLEREILDLETASQNFQQGVFRLLVLGDMKRGKSTFLNALIGENIVKLRGKMFMQNESLKFQQLRRCGDE